MSRYDVSRLSEEEQQSLAECEGFHSFAQMSQWRTLQEEMGRMVGGAVRELQACRSSDPAVSHSLRLTLQARTDIMAAVVNYVESRVEERERLLLLAVTEDDDEESAG